jgi:hypothetical protein
MVGNAREVELPLTVADVFKNPTFEDMLQCMLKESVDDSEGTYSDEGTVYSENDPGLAEEELYEPFSLLYQEDPEQFVNDYICPAVHVPSAGIADVLPTTDFQSLAITGSMLDSRWMLNYFYLDGSGPLDIGLLRQSVAKVVASYDILRTVFVQHGRRYLQAVLRQLQPEFIVHDDVEDIEKFSAQLEVKSRDETPRLGEPYIRFIVALHKSTERHRIFLRISHAQYDGVCFPAILEALKAGYEGDPILPMPSFAKFVRGALGRITPEHYAYWKNLLRGSTMTNVVPRDETALATGPTTVLKRVVPLRSLASMNITTATIVKAAWSMVLAQATGKSDIVFGHIISGRNIDVPGIENIVGPCLNMVPVRVKYQTAWTVLQLLQYVQNQQVDNMPYESLGFREIIKKCTSWNKRANFSTVLQHQSMAQTGNLTIGDNAYTVGAIASQEDSADFSVVTTPKDANSIEACLIFAQNGTITTSLAEQMFDSLCTAIASFSADPAATLPSPNEIAAMQH